LFCPGCGSNNDDQARFCYRCGRQLHTGTEAPQSGPAWRDFVEPAREPEPEPPPPEPPPPPPLPPPQVVIGKPKRELPIAALITAIFGLGIFGGAGYGILYAVQNIDTNSLPFIGNENNAAAETKAPVILISLTSACKDSKGQDCNLIWDVTSIKAEVSGLRIAYELRATGQSGCSVAIEADNGLTGKIETTGRPGPHLEGARGRYYPLLSSEGLTSSGGTLTCDAKQTGAWVFPTVAGESFVKLRYPGLPPARIELDPVSARGLPADDPPAVIPVQQANCQTVQNQPCHATWEIGPYGIAKDGAPIVFFAVRFEGPATNCQVNWQNDVDANKALIGKGDKGIRLHLGGTAGDLGLTAGGGLSAQNGPLNCNSVFAGFWRFAPGNVSQNVDLLYPDFPDVQVPIKP
jgi:hypothetical protein